MRGFRICEDCSCVQSYPHAKHEVVHVGAAKVKADHRLAALHVFLDVSLVDFFLRPRDEACLAPTSKGVVREVVLVLLFQAWPLGDAQRHRFRFFLAVQLSGNLCLHLFLEVHPEVVQPHEQLSLAP